jgi:hypothetical protein
MCASLTTHSTCLISILRSDLRGESSNVGKFGAREHDEMTTLLREVVELLKNMNQRQALFGARLAVWLMV